MDYLLFGMTLSMSGKVLLGISVLLVHAKIIRSHRIDAPVISEMLHERYLAIFGITLIIIGYVAEITSFGYLSFIFQ